MKKTISLGIVVFMLFSMLSTSVVFAFGAKAPEKQKVIHMETVIEPKYEHAETFSDELAVVKINGKYGAIDESGKVVVQPVYDALGRFNEGYAVAGIDGVLYILNAETGEAVCPSYEVFWGEEYDESTGEYKTIYKTTTLKYSDPELPSTWYCQEGVINVGDIPCLTDGTILVDIASWETQYKMLGSCVNGLIPVQTLWYGSYGVQFIDKQGNVVKYVDTDDYDLNNFMGWENVTLEAYAPVDDRIVWMPATSVDEMSGTYYGKVGLLDANYNMILAPTYNGYRYSYDGTFFHNGLMVVELNEKFGAIDKNGNEVIPCEYDFIDVFNKDYTFAIKEGVGYLMDTNSNLYEIVGMDGAKTNITACSAFNDNGIAVVYDSISCKAFCISSDIVDGKAHAIPGTDNLDISVFVLDYDEGAKIDTVRAIGDDLIPYEEDGKWGYMRLTICDMSDLEENPEKDDDDEDDDEENDKADEKSSLFDSVGSVIIAVTIAVIALGGGGYALVYVLRYKAPRNKK